MSLGAGGWGVVGRRNTCGDVVRKSKGAQPGDHQGAVSKAACSVRLRSAERSLVVRVVLASCQRLVASPSLAQHPRFLSTGFGFGYFGFGGKAHGKTVRRARRARVAGPAVTCSQVVG